MQKVDQERNCVWCCMLFATFWPGDSVFEDCWHHSRSSHDANSIVICSSHNDDNLSGNESAFTPAISRTITPIRGVKSMTSFKQYFQDSFIDSKITGFADMNSMYKRVGVKFERKKKYSVRVSKGRMRQAHEKITSRGDSHLVTLEKACNEELRKIEQNLNDDFEDFNLPDGSIVSNSSESIASVSSNRTAPIYTNRFNSSNNNILDSVLESKVIENRNRSASENILSHTNNIHTSDNENVEIRNVHQKEEPVSDKSGDEGIFDGSTSFRSSHSSGSKRTQIERLTDIYLAQSEVYLLQGKYDLAASVLVKALRRIFESKGLHRSLNFIETETTEKIVISDQATSPLDELQEILQMVSMGFGLDAYRLRIYDLESLRLHDGIVNSINSDTRRNISTEDHTGVDNTMIHRESEDDVDIIPWSLAVCLGRLGSLLRVRNELTLATNCLKTALMLMVMMRAGHIAGSAVEIGNCYSSLAVVLEQLGNQDEAKIADKTAFELFSLIPSQYS